MSEKNYDLREYTHRRFAMAVGATLMAPPERLPVVCRPAAEHGLYEVLPDLETSQKGYKEGMAPVREQAFPIKPEIIVGTAEEIVECFRERLYRALQCAMGLDLPRVELPPDENAKFSESQIHRRRDKYQEFHQKLQSWELTGPAIYQLAVPGNEHAAVYDAIRQHRDSKSQAEAGDANRAIHQMLVNAIDKLPGRESA